MRTPNTRGTLLRILRASGCKKTAQQLAEFLEEPVGEISNQLHDLRAEGLVDLWNQGTWSARGSAAKPQEAPPDHSSGPPFSWSFGRRPTEPWYITRPSPFLTMADVDESLRKFSELLRATEEAVESPMPEIVRALDESTPATKALADLLRRWSVSLVEARK